MGQKMASVFSFISTNHILELIGFITLILLFSASFKFSSVIFSGPVTTINFTL